MSSETISAKKILRFAVTLLVVSCISAVAFILFRHTDWRGPAAGFGIMSSLFASAVAGWFAFRARDPRLIAAALISVLPLAFWVWVVYHVVYVNAA